MSKLARLSQAYRVTKGRRFRLKDVRPGHTGGLDLEKDHAKALLQEGVARLRVLQERLYAQDRWSLLLVFQAMDAAGKDGTIEHVMSGVNPQGCQVFSFKAPTSTELDHDWMWRTTCALPERGRIGIFNRSYYEEVLVVRVHPEILAKQHLPSEVVGKRIWKERHEDIRNFESYLARNGTVVLKFFLHVSRKEQKRRFLERIETPEKNWKFALGDVLERARWNDYMEAYEDAIRATATKDAPWYVVPADEKWFTRLVVASAVIDAMERLDLRFPSVDDAKRAELAKAKAMLEAEGGTKVARRGTTGARAKPPVR